MTDADGTSPLPVHTASASVLPYDWACVVCGETLVGNSSENLHRAHWVIRQGKTYCNVCRSFAKCR